MIQHFALCQNDFFNPIALPPDALGMSASLRSRPNLRTAAIRRGCHLRTVTAPQGKHPSYSDHLVARADNVRQACVRITHLVVPKPASRV